MPYYVYAIHRDHTSNRPYGIYDSLEDALVREQRMREGNFPHDNYFVTMFHADNDQDAEEKADALRPYPQIEKERVARLCTLFLEKLLRQEPDLLSDMSQGPRVVTPEQKQLAWSCDQFLSATDPDERRAALRRLIPQFEPEANIANPSGNAAKPLPTGLRAVEQGLMAELAKLEEM